MNQPPANRPRSPTLAALTLFVAIFSIVTFVVTLVGIICTCLQPVTYASTARFQVEPDPRYNADASSRPADEAGPLFLPTQLEIIRSQLVLSNAIRTLNLNVAWGKKFFAGEPLKTFETAVLLKNRIEAAPVAGTRLLSLTVFSDDPQEAADLANAIARSYADYRENIRTNLANTRIGILQAQYQDQTAAIEAARRRADDSKVGELLEEHRLLYPEIAREKLELLAPAASLVTMVDTAEPGRQPARPNKPLDITLSLLAGLFLGTLAGGATVLGQFCFGRRNG